MKSVTITLRDFDSILEAIGAAKVLFHKEQGPDYERLCEVATKLYGASVIRIDDELRDDDVCHCGMLMRDHKPSGSCTTPVSMGAPPDAVMDASEKVAAISVHKLSCLNCGGLHGHPVGYCEELARLRGMPQEKPSPDISTSVTEAKIGNKTVPLLSFPDGSFIHLVPEKMPEGYQNPIDVLRRWLDAWMGYQKDRCRRCGRELLFGRNELVRGLCEGCQ